MLTLIAEYHVLPGHRDEVERALKKMSVLVSKHEPGCRLYHANRSTDDENLLVLYEQYLDRDALEAHRETPHFKEIIETAVVPMLERRERRVCELIVG